MLAAALGAAYWKPIQAGLDGEASDSDTARALGVQEILPEAYRLTEPLSPHRAAELDGVVIDLDRHGNSGNFGNGFKTLALREKELGRLPETFSFNPGPALSATDTEPPSPVTVIKGGTGIASQA